jgi:hypothetical protein
MYRVTANIPRSTGGTVLWSDAKSADFLIYESFTTDVEFQGVKLSLWWKSMH